MTSQSPVLEGTCGLGLGTGATLRFGSDYDRRSWHVPTPKRVIARARRGLVVLAVDEVWAFEARNGVCLVHCHAGQCHIDLSLAKSTMGSTFAHIHAAGLRISGKCGNSHSGPVRTYGSGDGARMREQGVRVPMSREQTSSLRERLLEHSIGLRKSVRGTGHPAANGTRRNAAVFPRPLRAPIVKRRRMIAKILGPSRLAACRWRIRRCRRSGVALRGRPVHSARLVTRVSGRCGW